jgi:hypothetical protein
MWHINSNEPRGGNMKFVTVILFIVTSVFSAQELRAVGDRHMSLVEAERQLDTLTTLLIAAKERVHRALDASTHSLAELSKARAQLRTHQGGGFADKQRLVREYEMRACIDLRAVADEVTELIITVRRIQTLVTKNPRLGLATPEKTSTYKAVGHMTHGVIKSMCSDYERTNRH